MTGRPLKVPLHPLLYYVEGLVLDPAGGNDKHARTTFERAVADPNLRCGERVARSDVLAQVVRAGTILSSRSRAFSERWDKTLATLARDLLNRVSADGSVAFRPPGAPDGSSAHANAWAAMFARQAFAAATARDARGAQCAGLLI